MPSASPRIESPRVSIVGQIIGDDRGEDDGKEGSAEAEERENGRDEVCIVESLSLYDHHQYVEQGDGNGATYHGDESNSEICKAQKRNSDAAS